MADLPFLRKNYDTPHAHGWLTNMATSMSIPTLQQDMMFSDIRIVELSSADDVDRWPFASLEPFAIVCGLKEGRIRATAKLNATARDRHGGVDVSSI